MKKFNSKKIILVPIILLLIIGIVYFIYARTSVNLKESEITSPSATPANFNSMEIISLATTQVNDMVSGNFESTADTFDSTLSKVLDKNGLKTAWDSTVEPLGKHIINYSVDSSIKGDNLAVTIVEQYEKGGLKVTTSYNNKKEITGIHLNYATIEKDLVSTEKFEEHSIKIGEKYPLDGILTLPTSVKNPPVVLLVHGSGPNDKNSTIYQNTPFEDIAVSLADKGIATLRYDKRYYAYPEEATKLGSDLTLYDEVLEDVNFALDFLSTDQRVDTSNIFVLGHSLSGGLTPYIASQHDDVKGIISMAGSLKPLYEISYEQSKATEQTAKNGGYDDATTKIIEEQMKQVEKDILILREDLSTIPNNQILLGIYAGYQKSAKQYSGENYIAEIDIPILVLQGSADFQVKADTHFTLWQDSLSSRDNVTLKLYQGLNHLMMVTNGKDDVSEYQTKGSVSEDVISDIATFVKQQK